MLEEVKAIVILISPFALFFIGYILNSISTSIREISKDLSDLKVKLAGEYVTKEECYRLHADFEKNVRSGFANKPTI